MALASLPVWSFRPNWSEGVLESLEWLTEVMSSPTGAEQRVALRITPRRSFEFTVNPWKEDRSFYDHMISAFGASDWYLPVWHDVELLSEPVSAGTTVLPIDGQYREFFASNPAVILGESAMQSEAIEVKKLTNTTIEFKTPIQNNWPAGSRLYPALKSRLREQPASIKKLSDRVAQTSMAFYVDGPNVLKGDNTGWGFLWGFVWGGSTHGKPWYIRTGWGRGWSYDWGGTTAFPLPMFEGYPVVVEHPNEANNLTTGFSRILKEIDNDVGLIRRLDTAGRAFSNQQYEKIMRQRMDHATYRAFLYYLKGQLVPLWLPTFYEDFRLVEPAVSGNDFLIVKNTGFTVSGGPRPGREIISVETWGGDPIFRRVISSGFVGSNEILTLDSPLDTDIPLSSFRKISFMELNRLTQDRVEITHHTSAQGASSSMLSFRAAPNIRQATLVA